MTTILATAQAGEVRVVRPSPGCTGVCRRPLVRARTELLVATHTQRQQQQRLLLLRQASDRPSNATCCRQSSSKQREKLVMGDFSVPRRCGKR